MMLLPVVVSCSTDECEENTSALPLAGFYSSGKVPQAISLDTISVYGIGAPGDSAIISKKAGRSETYLPFDPESDESKFVIRYDALAGTSGGNAPSDTITFVYSKTPWFYSVACGVSYVYDIKDIQYSTNIIDSVACPRGVIDNSQGENIRIYFRTAQAGEGEKT